MDMEIINFQQSYVKELLDCWNTSLIYDTISEERFYELVLLDDNFDASLCRLAITEGHCIGFCYGVKRKVPYLERGLEPTRGWISIMAVKKEVQHLGIGKRLVMDVETRLREKGAENITLCAYSPNYFTPGVDVRYSNAIHLFDQLGYQRTTHSVSMQRSLWDYQMSEAVMEKKQKLEEEGIRILHYHKAYMCELLDYALDNFGAGWKRNILIAMQKKEAQDTILLCLNAENEIIGFCMRKIDGNESRFGPIGVNENLRSKGIGGVLFECMMQDMRRRGLGYLYFLWTDGAAQRFYERHAVEVYREYQLYRKEF